MENREEKRTPPPYLSWKTFSNYVRSLEQTIPNRIDTSGMVMLSGTNRNLVINALKFLNLIDNAGTPSDKLRGWVNAIKETNLEEKKRILREVIEEAYPEFFQGASKLEGDTPASFSNRFKAYKLGPDTTRKAETFFIGAAKEAGIKISPLVLKARRKGRRVGSTTTKRTPSKGDREKEINDGEINQEQQENEMHKAMIKTLTEKFPEFNPSWDAEAQAAWFEMYGKLLNIAKKSEEDE